MGRRDSLRAFAGAVSKRHGAGSLTMGSRVADIPRLRTGALLFDVALGGGLPIGRVTMFMGEKSSGKTTAAYMIGGLAQKLCANCYRPVDTEIDVEEVDGEEEFFQTGHCDCYKTGLFEPRQYPDEKNDEYKARIAEYESSGSSYSEFRVALLDVEGSFDRVWAAKQGLDERLIVYSRPSTAEEAVDIYDGLARTGSVDLMILDSIAQMTPSKEVEDSTENWQQGLQARLVNKLSRKCGSANSDVKRDFGIDLTHIWVNQFREKIGVMFGPKEVVPGGKGQGFLTSVEVKMWASQYDVGTVVELPGKESDFEIASSARMNFKVEKNKTAPAKGRGSYVLDLRTGKIVDDSLMVALAEKFGFLRKESATKWFLGDDAHKTKTAAIGDLLGDKRVVYYGMFLELMLRGKAA